MRRLQYLTLACVLSANIAARAESKTVVADCKSSPLAEMAQDLLKDSGFQLSLGSQVLPLVKKGMRLVSVDQHEDSTYQCDYHFESLDPKIGNPEQMEIIRRAEGSCNTEPVHIPGAERVAGKVKLSGDQCAYYIVVGKPEATCTAKNEISVSQHPCNFLSLSNPMGTHVQLNNIFGYGESIGDELTRQLSSGADLISVQDLDGVNCHYFFAPAPHCINAQPVKRQPTIADVMKVETADCDTISVSSYLSEHLKVEEMSKYFKEGYELAGILRSATEEKQCNFYFIRY